MVKWGTDLGRTLNGNSALLGSSTNKIMKALKLMVCLQNSRTKNVEVMSYKCHL